MASTETKTIEVDVKVFEKLAEIAIPFVDITPNMVLRRILKLGPETEKNVFTENQSTILRETRRRNIRDVDENEVSHELKFNTEEIDALRRTSDEVHPAFLTFLMDKYLNAHGNYKTQQIRMFMQKANLVSSEGVYRNPWMNNPYRGQQNGLISCQRTIEHFRQARKFGCWGGMNTKEGCNKQYDCIYHPSNPDGIKNKCDLRKGVIWKRIDSNSPFSYGSNYIQVVKNELLRGSKIQLDKLILIFYPDEEYSQELINCFKKELNFSEEEMGHFFSEA